MVEPMNPGALMTKTRMTWLLGSILAMLKLEERCGLRRDVPSASRNERLGFEQGRLFYVK